VTRSLIHQIDAPFLQTFTGLKFHPFFPRPEEICIADIAHGLAATNRFAGMTIEPYSVAQHSIHVSRLVPPQDALWGLLHDASEAYLLDMPRPIKEYLPEYREVEQRVMEVICERFGLDPREPASVKDADRRLLSTEHRDLMRPGLLWETDTVPPLEDHIKPWGHRDAERLFLSAFHCLTLTRDRAA